MLTLDGELSDEEKYGKLASQQEIGSMMGALDRAGIPSEKLKEQMLATWNLTTRKQLRKGHLLEIGKWIAAQSGTTREPGAEG